MRYSLIRLIPSQQSRSSHRWLATALVATGCLWLNAVAFAADEDFAALVTAAREKFVPISSEQEAAAQAGLVKQAGALERYLRPRSANGKKWLAYLQWDALKKALTAEGEPEFEPLVATYGQLNKDQTGLELKPFRATSDALRHYIDVAVMARQPNQAETYGGQLDGLAKELEQYSSAPTAATGSAIGRRLDLLAGLGQAPELVAAVREEFAQPNALFTVSTDLLRSAADPIDRHDPITDVILGTQIRGQGHTIGTVSLDTVPNADKAIIKLTTDGRVVSQNVGRNGPAVIRSTGYTDFDATQLVEFTATGFRALPAKVSATTRSNIHSVSKAGGGMGRRVVANVGMQKAHEKQGQANRIAADHAETRIARRMTDQVDERLRKAWKRYQNDYRLPLERRGELPRYTRFSTTDTSLAFETTQANRGQLAAPGAPPESPSDSDLVLRLHESAVNNYTAALLSGATISESTAGEGTKADVTLPPWIKDAWKNRMDEKAEEGADFEPWALTFRRDRPITAAFVDGKVQLTIHVAHLKSGDDVFDRWDVSATYTPEMADGGVTLRRDGELAVLPTGFDQEKGQLSSRQVAVRRNLTKVLTERSDKGRGIPLTIKVEKLEPKDDLADVGPLPVKEFASGDGWLTVAWNRQ
ncbi:MAG: hypothetical protein WD971_03795 [Pirellulales bacterium]